FGAAWCNLDWRLRPVELDILLTLIAPRLLIAERSSAVAPAHIAEAAVIGRADERLGEGPVALFGGAAAIRVSGVAGPFPAHLQPHKVPVEFRQVDALPKTDNGKIRRAALGSLLD